VSAGATPVRSGEHEALIRLAQVFKSFDGGRSFAVRDVTVAIPRGAFVAVVGGSGSGKTTTLKMINRLIEADRGEVCVEGQSVHELSGPLLRRRIGYVFQGIGLFPHMSVEENVGITAQLLGWSKQAIAERRAELLELVALPRALWTRLPAELSGGQQQRVGVARALAVKPAIMLMDEPFGALDPITRDTLGVEYRRLHEQMGLTTVMVTHDVLEAVLLADRIVVMRDGAVVADDTPQALFANHADAGVRRLMDMPRRQAERVRALIDGAAARG
jgi:osmoprotectant transport system ATP-binding protein